MKEAVFDIETPNFDESKGYHTRNVPFICGAIIDDEGEYYYTDVEKFSEHLETYDRVWGHNALKFDSNVMKTSGYPLKHPVVYDTQIAAHMLDENNKVGLNECSKRYLGEEKTQSIKKGFVVDPHTVEGKEYVLQDTRLGFKLMKLFKKMLKEQDLWNLFTEVYMPMGPLLEELTENGIYVNQEKLDNLIEKFEERIEGAQTKFLETYGVNINSPQQLGSVIYRLPWAIPKTKSGYPKTDVDTIEAVCPHLLRDAAQEVLDYRKDNKQYKTYVKAAKKASSVDGYIHPPYNMDRTATGRLSAGGDKTKYWLSYQIQNVDVRVRHIFEAPPGYRFALVDADQLELRVLAGVTMDPDLMRVFAENLDPHAMTASKLFGVDLAEVTGSQRADGKTTNFAVVYGTTDHGLAHAMRISLRLAQERLKAFYEGYPMVSKRKALIEESVVSKGHFRNNAGRYRRFPNLNTSSAYQVNEAVKKAFSLDIQGYGAELMKKCALYAIPRLRNKYKCREHTHDEFAFYVPEETADESLEEIRQIFEATPLGFPVPIKFSGAHGASWAEVK